MRKALLPAFNYAGFFLCMSRSKSECCGKGIYDMESMIGLNWEDKVPEMVSIREASRRTGLSYDFLRKECLKGNLVHIRVGTGKFLINFGFLVEQMNSARGYIRKNEE